MAFHLAFVAFSLCGIRLCGISLCGIHRLCGFHRLCGISSFSAWSQDSHLAPLQLEYVVPRVPHTTRAAPAHRRPHCAALDSTTRGAVSGAIIAVHVVQRLGPNLEAVFRLIGEFSTAIGEPASCATRSLSRTARQLFDRRDPTVGTTRHALDLYQHRHLVFQGFDRIFYHILLFI